MAARAPWLLGLALVVVGACSGRAETASAPAPTPSQACGAPHLPDCPLQRFMKAAAVTALGSMDFPRLDRAFARISDNGRPNYPGWGRFAADGRAAVAARDMEAARRACKGCHDAYREGYRRDFRAATMR